VRQSNYIHEIGNIKTARDADLLHILLRRACCWPKPAVTLMLFIMRMHIALAHWHHIASVLIKPCHALRPPPVGSDVPIQTDACLISLPRNRYGVTQLPPNGERSRAPCDDALSATRFLAKHLYSYVVTLPLGGGGAVGPVHSFVLTTQPHRYRAGSGRIAVPKSSCFPPLRLFLPGQESSGRVTPDG
jgi:hypothetical protein